MDTDTKALREILMGRTDSPLLDATDERDALRVEVARLRGAGVSDEVRKLVGRIDQFRMCMSYNDSYFGEPAGLLKGVFSELARAVNPIYPCGKTALYPDLVPTDRIMIYESEGEGASFAAILADRAAVKGSE